MKIAVVGGGIYGCVIADRLAVLGHKVSLFERKKSLMLETSGSNQLRIHRGYHYPRATDTVCRLENTVSRFESRYRPAIVSDNEHYYAIAKDESKTSATEFLRFSDKHRLPVERVNLDLLRKSSSQLTVKVPETLLNVNVLRTQLAFDLKTHNVHVHLEANVAREDLRGFDLRIWCTYAFTNRNLLNRQHFSNYKFQICEKPFIRLPSDFSKKSVVVIDGPFMCIDPYCATDQFLLGNVRQAVHSENIGFFPEVPGHLVDLVNQGLVPPPSFSKFKQMVAAGTQFFPLLEKAEHLGSFFTIRAVLPYSEATDERPTLVNRVGPTDISVFSGKIANVIYALDLIERYASDLDVGTSRLPPAQLRPLDNY